MNFRMEMKLEAMMIGKKWMNGLSKSGLIGL